MPSATMLVLVAAVASGVVAGAVLGLSQQQPPESQAKAEKTAEISTVPRPPIQTQAPLVVPVDPSEAQWERRAEANRPSTGTARTTGAAPVTASFTYCYSGGGTDCVVDGDTFYIGGAKVRIADIDAPETHPPRCAYEARLGNAATERLHALLNSGVVTMRAIDRDRDKYGRLLRNVEVNGADVGETLVSAGLAREWTGHREPWC